MSEGRRKWIDAMLRKGNVDVESRVEGALENKGRRCMYVPWIKDSHKALKVEEMNEHETKGLFANPQYRRRLFWESRLGHRKDDH